ncbi:hypothetical protein [Ralstonia phage phiRSL1]|uniref:Glycosyltransferase n=1 Tax=Ralstonia phage phiRSL1 TaxID=1980924 RepID=B2ZY71_9CAUD|nr:hypothetical protein RSL1_ORF258 [Ralstonia phage phiRSL1]BAG41706.1 hypothetical protein [Ralstonia phage phiRSL1]
MTYPRTLFVLKYRDSDYNDINSWCYSDGKKPLSSGLFNSARMVVDMLMQHGVPVKLVHVQDNSTIYREAMAFQAEVVIVEAFWVVPEKFDELLSVNPKIKYVIRNHSETPFLAQEGIAFDWMLKYVQRPNVVMSANSPRMYEETLHLVQMANPSWTPEHIASKVAYLPNYYPTTHLVDGEMKPDHCDTLDIGCFGAVRPLKNHMEQAIGALKLAARLNRRLRFHINGGRIEMNGDQILKNLRLMFKHYPQHELVEHPWMVHAKFKELVASMDLVTQVSFSETFNIVAADAVVLGVPTIGSREITWLNMLYQADPTSSDSIAAVMDRALCMKRRFPRLNLNAMGLRGYDKRSERDWLSFLAHHK